MADPFEMTPEREGYIQRYNAALHAMQTGVAYEMAKDSKKNTPKDLRVGVNSAMISDAALARLLVAKGVFTIAEYESELADEAEREVVRYEARNPGMRFG